MTNTTFDLTKYTYTFSRYNTQTLESIFARYIGCQNSEIDLAIYIGFEKSGNRENWRNEIIVRLDCALERQQFNQLSETEKSEIAASSIKKMNARLLAAYASDTKTEKSEIVALHNAYSDNETSDYNIALDRILHYAINGGFPKGRPQSISNELMETIATLYTDFNVSVNVLARFICDDLNDKKQINSCYNTIYQYLVNNLPSEYVTGKKLNKRDNEFKDYKSCDLDIFKTEKFNELPVIDTNKPNLSIVMLNTADDIILELSHPEKYQTRIESRKRATELQSKGFGEPTTIEPIKPQDNFDTLWNACKPISASMKPVGTMNKTDLLLNGYYAA